MRTAGALRLPPHRVWDMTPAELAAYAEGYEKAQRQWWEQLQWLLAWHAAHLMNMWRGKGQPAITPARLMGRAGRTFTSPEELRDYMRQRAQERGE